MSTKEYKMPSSSASSDASQPIPTDAVPVRMHAQLAGDPVHAAGGGFQWGSSGKVYHGAGAKGKAAKQGKAAYESGYKGK